MKCVIKIVDRVKASLKTSFYLYRKFLKTLEIVYSDAKIKRCMIKERVLEKKTNVIIIVIKYLLRKI